MRRPGLLRSWLEARWHVWSPNTVRGYATSRAACLTQWMTAPTSARRTRAPLLRHRPARWPGRHHQRAQPLREL